ncbi:MAG TPA: response regulator [Gemmatimonadales bacterium]|nr:response regulator [Gemmatimonadales bacterium]
MSQGTAVRIVGEEYAGPRHLASDGGKETGDAAQSGLVMGRIVVIDDEPLILRATQRLLQGLGHRVRTYADGRIAVELMRRERAEVALVDLHMDEMDGIQVVCRLLALDQPPALIVMSGEGRAPVQQRLAELGLADRVGYLGKPFTIGELEEELARVLKSRRAH